MKKILMVVLGCALLGIPALAQDADGGATLKQFTRSVELDGVTLYLVHLNDRTVDVLFQAPTKYSMRARTHQSTVLYVQGTPDKAVELNTKFSIEQDGETSEGVSHDINNFKDGPVAKGERIDGIVIFDKMVDPSHPFKVTTSDKSVEFKLSGDALKLLESQPNNK